MSQKKHPNKTLVLGDQKIPIIVEENDSLFTKIKQNHQNLTSPFSGIEITTQTLCLHNDPSKHEADMLAHRLAGDINQGLYNLETTAKALDTLTNMATAAQPGRSLSEIAKLAQQDPKGFFPRFFLEHHGQNPFVLLLVVTQKSRIITSLVHLLQVQKTPNTKNKINNLIILENEAVSVLFNKDTLSLRQLPKNNHDLKKLLTLANQVPPDSPLWQKIAMIVDHFSDVAVQLPEGLAGHEEFCREEREKTERLTALNPKKVLYKLAINTANACNLACIYCYAAHGLYGEKTSFLMNPKDVETALHRFARHFDLIEQIQFMGGEPSLNTAAMQETARVCRQLVADGALKAMPRMGLVSNGVGFSREFWLAVTEIPCTITFSIDGPREIHNQTRPHPNGQGSFDEAVDNLNEAWRKGVRTDFEATFTKMHLNEGLNLVGLCQWFFDTFGKRVLHAPPVGENKHALAKGFGLSIDEKIQEYTAVSEWGINNLGKGTLLMHGFTQRLLQSLIKKEKNEWICAAGKGMLCLSTAGDVYPCWQYTNEKPFYMGNIHGNDFLGKTAASVAAMIDQYDLLRHPKCQQCWMQPLCFGCTGGDFLATQAIGQHPECDYKRAMAGTVILKTVELLHNKTKFS